MTDSGAVRLLFCHDCRSVDQVPDFDGPPEYDHYLEYRVQQHRFPNGEPHRGILGRCDNNETAIQAAIDQMASNVTAGEGVGLGQPMYDLRDNYKTEAMQCWKKHNRTADCGDYRSDGKRLYADTKADRRAEHMPTSLNERPNAWLCDFCVVHSLVQQKQRKAKGLDK
jgi:hypothetical protein